MPYDYNISEEGGRYVVHEHDAMFNHTRVMGRYDTRKEAERIVRYSYANREKGHGHWYYKKRLWKKHEKEY